MNKQRRRTATLLRILMCVLSLSYICSGQQSAGEKAVWHQEKGYWQSLAERGIRRPS